MSQYAVGGLTRFLERRPWLLLAARGESHVRASEGRGFSPAVPTRSLKPLGNVGARFAAGLKPRPSKAWPNAFHHGLLGCLLVLLLGSNAARVESRPQRPDPAASATLVEAQELLREGHAEDAMRLLSGWLATHPHDVEALATLGSIYAQQGRLEEAETVLARAVKIEPASPALRLKWATVLDRLHRYPEAAAALARVAPPVPGEQRIAYERLKASIDLGRGDAKAAAHDMERALRLAPEDRNLLLAAGIAEVQAGAWTEAAAHLRPVFAASHNPAAGVALLEAEVGAHADHASTLKDLDALDLPSDQRLPLRERVGEILSGSGFLAEAVEQFQKAVAEEPQSSDLYFNLALAQFRAGEGDAALATAQHAQSLGDSAALESLLGDVQEARGDSLAAVRSYQAAVALAPDQEQLRLSLGLELVRHQTFEPALAVFQQAAKMFPKSSRARLAVGLTHYFLDQYPEAIQTLREASALDPHSELALDYLGDIQLQQPVKPDPAAIDQICRYAGNHPGREALAYCGALELRVEHDRGDAGPSTEVIEKLRQAARLMPANATARCSLGQALEWSRQWQPAEEEMEACVRLRPDSVEAHYRMANIARYLGETGRAQQELKLHDEAQQHLVEANAARDRTLQKFLYTMASAPSESSPQP